MGILIVERGGLIKTIEPPDQTLSASNENRSDAIQSETEAESESEYESGVKKHKSIDTQRATSLNWVPSFLGVTENCRSFNDRQLISTSLHVQVWPVGVSSPASRSLARSIVVVVSVLLTAASSASLTFPRFNHQTWRWLPLMVVMMPCSVPCLVACHTCAFIGI